MLNYRLKQTDFSGRPWRSTPVGTRTLRFGNPSNADDKLFQRLQQRHQEQLASEAQRKQPLYRRLMEKVLSQVQHYYGHMEHLAGLVTLKRAEALGLLTDKQGIVLINVDTHSDLFNP